MSNAKVKEMSKKEQTELKKLAEIAEGRADLYKFFSALYAKPPTKKLISKLIEPTFIEEMTLLFGKRAMAPIRDFAEKYDERQDYKDMAQEFHDLFLVPIEHKYITPFESVYLTGLMLQRPYADVKQAYKTAGADFSSEENISLEDYIGCELSFMQFLSEREQKAWKKFDKDEAIRVLEFEVKFLENHLTLWVDDFAKRIAKNAEFPIYKGVGRMTARYINLDYRQCADLLDQLQTD